MGLQGYSSPTEEHVIFCVAKELIGTFEAMREVVEFLRAGQSKDVRYYTGMYKGVLESAYVLPHPAFLEFIRRWPQFMHDQESVLVLGTPKAMNHRPARLHFFDASIPMQDMGMFIETDRETALASVGYTHARMKDGRDKYWICVNNPADCVAEEEHRALTEVMFAAYMILGGIVERSTTVVTNTSTEFGVSVPYEKYALARTGESSYTTWDNLHNALVGRRRVNGVVCTSKYLLDQACE